MKKNKLLVILFFNIFFLNIALSQKNGKVVYEIKSIDFVPKEQNSEVDEMIEKAKKQTFILLFNEKNLSNFEMVNTMSKEENPMNDFLEKMAAIRFTCNFTFFSDNNQNKNYYLYSDGTIVHDNSQKKWLISKETKEIDGYLCYQATHKYEYLARNNKMKERIITAWFAPSLPYSFGPKNYNGLPGLILELQDWDTTFLATKIELSDKEIVIDLPKGKTITQEEYERKVLSGN
ncbi:GLPGLI family protein [Flavobacterium dankookense]|uniref:GLPGLI family protein n=1 Tax=Flavobacterium dankookense TaxID=706186 RepID=A0A4R6QHH8_9FLAO|nr:GLPGLI family protein [Flavobacterium dankookense]TDP61946.1 GLPGLI family protein [Flavobacterium dankookense]